jgi:regulator of nonsense transcripts 2
MLSIGRLGSALELLPYYGRIAATLGQCMKDVGPALTTLLDDEFYALLTKKDQINLESKIRNCRFLGELVKFKVVPPMVVFNGLKRCLDDFTHHNIDVVCHLLECCGPFLYRSPESSTRTANLLDILWRLKNAKNLDASKATLVENAYYQCKPPERAATRCKKRTPLQEYIRYLLFSKLSRSTVEKVLRQLRKLVWPDCEPYIVSCVLKVCKARYSQLQLAASLAAGLNHRHSSFGVTLVDALLEEMRTGLEDHTNTSSAAGQPQRRIAQMRLLGELYNYRLVDSKVVFQTLHSILSFGYDREDALGMDPLHDFFRVRMVICLLETCGSYFDRGSSKAKLDRYLVYFQRYILSKGSLPMDVEFDVQDLLEFLRPRLSRMTTFEEACLAVTTLEADREAVMTSGGAGGGRGADASEGGEVREH